MPRRSHSSSTTRTPSNPPDEAHRYRFKLFALETTLDLPPETDVQALGDAMAGRVLARTQLDGTFRA